MSNSHSVSVSQPADCDIAICGGSFAGLALARALAMELKDSLKIVVIEPARAEAGVRPSDNPGDNAAASYTDSRASHLSAGSQRMLNALDVWPEIASHAQPVTRIEITDAALDDGVRPVLLTYDNVLASGEPASYIVPNATLLSALRAAVVSSGVASLAAEATGYTANAESVSVALSNGRSLRAALLVAADGRRSRLRDAARIKLLSWPTGQRGIIATLAHDRPHRGTAVQHFLQGGPFAILPLIGNRSCITWSEDARVAKTILALDDARFLDEVEQRVGGRLGTLRLDGPRQSWLLENHLARTYVAPRFALVGDAAHGVHPIAGQGLNLALRDAAALAEVLIDSGRLGFDYGEAEALARYERWRRTDSVTATFAFDALNRVFSQASALLRAARGVGLGVLDRLPQVKSLLVDEAAGVSGDIPRLMRVETA